MRRRVSSEGWGAAAAVGNVVGEVAGRVAEPVPETGANRAGAEAARSGAGIGAGLAARAIVAITNTLSAARATRAKNLPRIMAE